jgi:hypothetical protein
MPPIALKAKEGDLLVSTTPEGQITLPVIWDRLPTKQAQRYQAGAFRLFPQPRGSANHFLGGACHA